MLKFTFFTTQASHSIILKFARLKFQWFIPPFPPLYVTKHPLKLFSPNFASYFHIKTLIKTKFIRWTQPLIFVWRQPHVRCFWVFWQFALWLVTQDLHRSHKGMIFSNKASLLLDFSRICSKMWVHMKWCEIEQSLFIYIFVWARKLPRSSSMMSRKKRRDKLVPMTEDVTFKIGYSLLVQTLKN